jgi:cell division protein FtsZ
MFEVDEAAKVITESVDPDANIIFGSTIREDYEGEIKITVVATGFDENSNKKAMEEKVAAPKTINPFGRKTVSDSRISAPVTNPVSAPAPKSNIEDDLDVPAFLRKRKL